MEHSLYYYSREEIDYLVMQVKNDFVSRENKLINQNNILMEHIKTLIERVNKLENEVKRVDELEDAIKYISGGEIYEEAKKDFYELCVNENN